MRYPGLDRLLRGWRYSMKLPRKYSIRAVYVHDLSWLAVPYGVTPDTVYGVTIATQHGCLILIDMSSCTPDTVKATLIHELVHCEQRAAGMEMNHGAYFAQRKAELKERFGVTI